LIFLSSRLVCNVISQGGIYTHHENCCFVKSVLLIPLIQEGGDMLKRPAVHYVPFVLAVGLVLLGTIGCDGHRSHHAFPARFVAFASGATNLVTGDTNGYYDIFVRDRLTGATTRVSVDSNGVQANNTSGNPSISGDGRFVAFRSNATNLVSGDTNDKYDIFVRDRLAGVTTRVSVDSTGAQANNHSGESSISANGRFVAFQSGATNLVTGDTNDKYDIFVRDRLAGVTTRVSVDSNGVQANNTSGNPSISGDGRFVAFRSDATNLVAGDTNDEVDVFVHDRDPDGNGIFDEGNGATTRVSVDSNGVQGNNYSNEPSISADGRFVAFVSRATNLVTGDTNDEVDVFVHDRDPDGNGIFDEGNGATTRVSVDSTGAQATGGISVEPSISADGRFVAFASDATNLVTGDTNDYEDVFVRDRLTGVTTRVSVDSTGAQATDDDSDRPSISADGRFVAFETKATNLVTGDTNGERDIFVHDRLTGVTTRVSIDSTGAQATGGDSDQASISGP
jgi:Tol biopolymer transport system component